MLRYGVGQYYKEHMDVISDHEAGARACTVLMYLNGGIACILAASSIRAMAWAGAAWLQLKQPGASPTVLATRLVPPVTGATIFKPLWLWAMLVSGVDIRHTL